MSFTLQPWLVICFYVTKRLQQTYQTAPSFCQSLPGIRCILIFVAAVSRTADGSTWHTLDPFRKGWSWFNEYCTLDRSTLVIYIFKVSSTSLGTIWSRFKQSISPQWRLLTDSQPVLGRVGRELAVLQLVCWDFANLFMEEFLKKNRPHDDGHYRLCFLRLYRYGVEKASGWLLQKGEWPGKRLLIDMCTTYVDIMKDQFSPWIS